MDTDAAKRKFREKIDTIKYSEIYDYVVNIFDHQIDCIAHSRQHIAELKQELSNRAYNDLLKTRKMVLPTERFVEEILVDSSGSKLTINPCSGRVSIKISKKCSPEVRDKLIKLSSNVLLFDKFLPFTYRGKFSYNKTNKQYEVHLYTSDNRSDFKFILED